MPQPGHINKREGEAEDHEQCPGLQLGRVQLGNHRLQLLHLLQERLVLRLQQPHLLAELLVQLGAALHPLLQPLHILLLPLAALLR